MKFIKKKLFLMLLLLSCDICLANTDSCHSLLQNLKGNRYTLSTITNIPLIKDLKIKILKTKNGDKSFLILDGRVLKDKKKFKSHSLLEVNNNQCQTKSNIGTLRLIDIQTVSLNGKTYHLNKQ